MKLSNALKQKIKGLTASGCLLLQLLLIIFSMFNIVLFMKGCFKIITVSREHVMQLRR